jgi:hypothetical protein
MYYSTVAYGRSLFRLAFFCLSVPTLVLIRQRKLTFTHTFAPRRPHSSSAGHTSSSSNSSDITVILDLDSVKEA